MRQSWLRKLLTAAPLAAALLAPVPAFAHADIVERISALDRQIEQTPHDNDLYFKRGELHRLHRDWPAARADYDRAAALDPDDTTVHFYRGRMWLEAGDPAHARLLLDRFLAERPDHADALLIRSRALAEIGEWQAAAQDLTHAIDLLDPPTPEVYLDRARALVAAGPEHIDPALRGLDAGIARLGPLVSLIQYAIEVERAHGRPQAALERFDLLPDQVRRQPKWLAIRGDILRSLGDVQQAQATYWAGLATIAAYPPARRNARATIELETRLRESLR
jgi:tetratricopeptide (TPR) repeat protein